MLFVIRSLIKTKRADGYGWAWIAGLIVMLLFAVLAFIAVKQRANSLLVT